MPEDANPTLRNPPADFVPSPKCPKCAQVFKGLMVVTMQLPDPNNPQGDPVFMLECCPNVECQIVMGCQPVGFAPHAVRPAGPSFWRPPS